MIVRALLLAAVAVGCGGRVASIDGSDPESRDVPAPADSASAAPRRDGSRTEPSIDPSTAATLFACTFDGGKWPSSTDGVVRVRHAGSRLVVDGRELPLTRVDKSGPYSGYVTYTLLAGGEPYALHGMAATAPPRPQQLVHRDGDEPASWWNCAEAHLGGGRTDEGVFDDAALDALVTSTGGKRTGS